MTIVGHIISLGPSASARTLLAPYLQNFMRPRRQVPCLDRHVADVNGMLRFFVRCSRWNAVCFYFYLFQPLVVLSALRYYVDQGFTSHVLTYLPLTCLHVVLDSTVVAVTLMAPLIGMLQYPQIALSFVS